MLARTPTTSDLERMYFELARMGASSVGSKRPWPYKMKDKEGLVALAADMSRFDPRLFGILVEFFVNHWRELNPTRLRGFYKEMNTPQAIAAVGEFLTGAVEGEDVRFFAQYISAGLRPVAPQFYYYNLYSPGGRLAQRALEEGVCEYKKWGFFASERPTLEKKHGVGSFDSSARRNILQRLLGEKEEIGLKDYLEALNFSISRQQALIDIKSSGLARPVGAGRGARWKSV